MNVVIVEDDIVALEVLLERLSVELTTWVNDTFFVSQKVDIAVCNLFTRDIFDLNSQISDEANKITIYGIHCNLAPLIRKNRQLLNLFT